MNWLETLRVNAATTRARPHDQDLACDEVRLSVNGIDVRFPAGDTMLRQLTHTFGLPSCRPPTTRAFTR